MKNFNYCGFCKHFTSTILINDRYVDFCEAFPHGIPEEILNGFDHTKPFYGDNGIRFEPTAEALKLDIFKHFKEKS